jgi:hypothetical protein
MEGQPVNAINIQPARNPPTMKTLHRSPMTLHVEIDGDGEARIEGEHE